MLWERTGIRVPNVVLQPCNPLIAVPAAEPSLMAPLACFLAGRENNL